MDPLLFLLFFMLHKCEIRKFCGFSYYAQSLVPLSQKLLKVIDLIVFPFTLFSSPNLENGFIRLHN